MLRFVVRRLLLLIPILIGLSILVFLWIRALPGGPAQALLGERATAESIQDIEQQYGLEQPIYTQYYTYTQTQHPTLPPPPHPPPPQDHGLPPGVPTRTRNRLSRSMRA